MLTKFIAHNTKYIFQFFNNVLSLGSRTFLRHLYLPLSRTDLQNIRILAFPKELLLSNVALSATSAFLTKMNEGDCQYYFAGNQPCFFFNLFINIIVFPPCQSRQRVNCIVVMYFENNIVFELPAVLWVCIQPMIKCCREQLCVCFLTFSQ